MAAVNSCGIGEFSENLEFVTNGCPKQMSSPVVYIEGKNVVIEWAEGQIDDGPPISGYEVQMRQQNKMLTPLESYCNVKLMEESQERKCVVPMSDIELLSKNQPGDLIQVSVRAKNVDCFGSFSLFNTEGAKMATCPSQMESVYAEPNNIKRTSISVNWQPFITPLGVDVDVESYEL
jgi:hypothetical protein